MFRCRIVVGALILLLVVLPALVLVLLVLILILVLVVLVLLVWQKVLARIGLLSNTHTMETR